MNYAYRILFFWEPPFLKVEPRFDSTFLKGGKGGGLRGNLGSPNLDPSSLSDITSRCTTHHSRVNVWFINKSSFAYGIT